MMQAGYDLGARWRAYCDCMFQEWALLDTYWINGVELVKPPNLPENAWLPYVNSMGKAATETGKKFEIRVEKRPLVTQNWTRCIARYCASPGGCVQADGRVDPFNMNPGMLADPWTEGGSATRGIPMRGGENKDWRWIRDLAALTVIDVADYDPVALWKCMWTNPAKFTLLVIKSQAVPFMSPYMLVLTSPEKLVFQAAQQIEARTFLGPNRMEKHLLKPVLEGNISFWKLAIQYLGRCGIGINVPCGIGEVLQQACKDQMNDRDANGVSELEKITDPNIRAGVVFLSQHGAELVQKAINAIQGLKDLTILAWLEMVFRQILNEPLLQKDMKWDTKLALTLLSTAAGVANVVYLGYQQKKSILEIADDIVDKLLGFRPSTVIAQLKGDVVAAKDAIQRGVTRTGVTLGEAVGYIMTVVNALRSLITTIKDINDKIGGGLEEIVSLVRDAVEGMNAATDATKSVIVQTQHAVQSAAVPPPSPVTVQELQQRLTLSPGGMVAVAKITQPAATPTSKATPSSGSGVAALALAAGGFVTAGPIGAAIGAGIGLMLNRGSGGSLAGMSDVRGYGGAYNGFGAVMDLSTGKPHESMIRQLAPAAHEQAVPDSRPWAARAEQALEDTTQWVESGIDTLVNDHISTARGDVKAGPVLLLGTGALVAWMLFKKPSAKRLGGMKPNRRKRR